MNYHPWLNSEKSIFAWLSEYLPEELTKNCWQLVFGMSSSSWFPGDVLFDLSVHHGIMLADFIPNVHRLFVVSDKLKSILMSAGSAIEFFPVRIRNHKMRTDKRRYYCANVLEYVSCVDHDQSDYRTNNLLKDQIFRFKKLVLDESKIPPEKKIFRLGEMKHLIIVEETLANEIITVNNCSGMLLQEMERFGAEFRKG